VARLNADQLRELVASVGLSGEPARIAVAVALAESSGRTDAIGDGGASIGLWQIHMPSHPRFTKGELLTPGGNARAMMAVSGGGANWRPWTMYRNGTYKQYLDPAGSLSGPVISGIGEVVDTAQDAAKATSGALRILGDAIGTLTDPAWWKRLGVGAAGILLLLVAGVFLIRSLVVDTVGKIARQVARGS
jgi:hypothetical protein